MTQKQQQIPPRKLAAVVGFTILALFLAGWSIFRAAKANDRTVQPPTAADLLKSMQNTDKQIEDAMRNPNMDEQTRQRVLGTLRGGRGRLERQYNTLKSGQKLTGP